jgi:carboxyl-terminal processing protease
MPISGGPSAKMGIRAGDRIVGVDGRDITGHTITNDTVTKLLKGPKGSKVKLRIYRPSINDYLDFEIVRDKIPMYSIDIAYMIDDSSGYIKINRFAATTYDEFVKKTDQLLRSGMRNLIIDLRDNGGGYLSEATSLCNDFLTEGEIIVYTEGRSRAKEFTYANAATRLKDIKLIILINELSASASEIVAGAIQDNDRGIIIGRRSFGKGLVQEQLEFADRSAIRLTVARYYTPTGRCIQKSYKNGYRDYEADLLHRYSNDELINPDSIHFIDSLKYVTKGGKIVYGGGGIMPDIFVPIDTSSLFSYFNALSDRGIIFQFAFHYLDQQREQIIRDYPNAKSFVHKFRIDESVIKELIKSAGEQGVKFNRKSYKFCKADIANRLKAYIGRGIYNDEAFYPVLLQKDKTFLKALEVLQNQGNSTIMQ